MDTEFVIQTVHLKKYFGSVRAVEDISLSVKHAEIFGFLGPNGAGKTTTISMILGLMHPTAGEVEVFGQRVTPEQNQVLRGVGTMVGAPALMLSFSARRNLQALLYLYPDIPSKRIDEVLEQVELTSVTNRPVHTFSTGMKQRLGLALALLNKPNLLILDEPTNGLDPAGMQEIRLLLHSLSEQGITVFLSSHLLHEMEQVCDRVAVVQQGQIIAQGTVKEMLAKNDVIRISASDLESIAQALTLLPGAQHVHTNGSNVEVQGVSSEHVMSYLVTQGLRPKEVSVYHPDLESVFLELTHKPA
ncbi:MAG: ABC transporter ATP-binding protein [Ktedonobacteraceae bacterium]